MKRSSIIRRKSRVNGQVLLEIKQTSKIRRSVSFKDSINNAHKSPKKKDKKTPSNTSSSKSLPKSQRDMPLKDKRYSVSSFYRPTSKFNDFINQKEEQNDNINSFNDISKRIYEDSDKKKKNASVRHSVQYKLGNDFAEKFSIKRRPTLNRTKEIVMGKKSEAVINTNDLDKFLEEKEDETKKKVNIIEESGRFNREQLYKMEKYIDKKRKRLIDYYYKKPPIYNNPENKKEISPITNRKKEKEKEDEIYSIKSSRSSNSNRSESEKNENRTITEERTSESEEEKSFSKIISETVKSEKDKNGKKNDNNEFKSKKENNNDNESKDKNKEDFQSIKKKYFPKFIFSEKFPNTEYKIKYLDNFFQNKASAKNLFREYTDIKKNNNNKSNITNYSNSFYKSPLSQKPNINKDKFKIYDIKAKSNNYISPKTLFSNINENESINSKKDLNNKFNNNDHSINSYSYMPNQRLFSNHKSYAELDETYKNILDSIDKKLNYKNKRSFINEGINVRSFSSPINKNEGFINSGYKSYKNSLDNSSFNFNNSYYKDICDKFNKYNGYKMRIGLIKRPNKYNSMNNFKNNYKNVNSVNGQYNRQNFYKGKLFYF